MGFLSFFYSQRICTLPYPTTSLTGKIVIVTGSNIGLGLEAARHFSRLDAQKVILAVRDSSKGEEAKKSIEASTGKNNVEVWNLDLASYASVKAFAQKVSKLPRLDAVVENAAVATRTYREAEGDESTITVNVTSTFLLALLLLPKLRETAQKYNVLPRLVILTSAVHAWTQLPEKSAPDGEIFNVLTAEKTADMAMRYPVSKLLEVLFVRELCSQISTKHPGDPSVVINMANPGLVHSALAREAGWQLAFFKFLFARSTEYGSRTETYAALDAGIESNGGYLDDCQLKGLAPFVTSEEGKQVGKRVYEELMAKLERIQPGISKNI